MTLDEYLKKQKYNMEIKPIFHKAWELTNEEKEKAKDRSAKCSRWF